MRAYYGTAIAVIMAVVILPANDLPFPTHPMYFGYYFADGRYATERHPDGDYTSEVFWYNNIYVGGPGTYDTSEVWNGANGPFRASLARAAAANKSIFLGMNRIWPGSCRKLRWRNVPADWLTTLPRYAA